MTDRQKKCLEWIRDNSPTLPELLADWPLEVIWPLKMRGHIDGTGNTLEITAAGITALG